MKPRGSQQHDLIFPRTEVTSKIKIKKNGDQPPAWVAAADITASRWLVIALRPYRKHAFRSYGNCRLWGAVGLECCFLFFFSFSPQRQSIKERRACLQSFCALRLSIKSCTQFSPGQPALQTTGRNFSAPSVNTEKKRKKKTERGSQQMPQVHFSVRNVFDFIFIIRLLLLCLKFWHSLSLLWAQCRLLSVKAEGRNKNRLDQPHPEVFPSKEARPKALGNRTGWKTNAIFAKEVIYKPRFSRMKEQRNPAYCNFSSKSLQAWRGSG